MLPNIRVTMPSNITVSSDIDISAEAMNIIDAISEKIDTTTSAFNERFGNAIDWTKDNILPTIYSFLLRYRNYKIIFNSVGILLLAVITFFSILGVIKICKSIKQEKEPWYDEPYSRWSILSLIMVFILCLTGIICVILIFVCAANIFNWLFVPEAGFIELLGHLS